MNQESTCSGAKPLPCAATSPALPPARRREIGVDLQTQHPVPWEAAGRNPPAQMNCRPKKKKKKKKGLNINWTPQTHVEELPNQVPDATRGSQHIV